MGIVKTILENLRPDSGKEASGKTKGANGKSKVTNKTLYKELINPLSDVV